MKIIFLDIDGVLNTQDTEDIDLVRVDRLHRIVKETNAKIVISSSWKDGLQRYLEGKVSRKISDYEMLIKAFKDRNIEIYDFTPDCKIDTYNGIVKARRGCEIRQWLHTHKDVEQYVILDDDNFEDWFCLTRRWVRTSYYEDGLNNLHVARAIQILNGNNFIKDGEYLPRFEYELGFKRELK